MSGAPSQLARHQPMPALSDGQLLALAGRAWIDYGIALFRPEDLASPFDRQAVINAAEKLYGRRRNDG